MPYIAELAEAGNEVAQSFMEKPHCFDYWCGFYDDLRGRNWADWLTSLHG